MTKAYDYYSKTNYDFGVLLVNDEATGGLFHAGLIYVSKSQQEGAVISMKTFYSAENEEDLIAKAERWIMDNLFAEFEKGAARSPKTMPGLK